MPKESLLSSMPKLILAVVLIVCVGAVMGLMGYVLTKKQVEVEAPEVKTPDEIIEDKTNDWQTYRNEEYGFSITFNEEYKDIWESETHHFNADMNSCSLARTDFYFKDYPLHIFSIVIIYEKKWFVENSEKRVLYKEWSAKNNGTIEEYNKIRDEMKSEFIREKGEVAWLKGDSDGYPLGTYLGENNDYVFILGIGPNGCIATELLCSLPAMEMIMDSFQIIDTSDWKTYRNEEFGFEVINHPECLDNNPPSIYDGGRKTYIPSLNLCGEKTEFPAYEFEEENLILFTDKRNDDHEPKTYSLKIISTQYPFEEKVLSTKINDLNLDISNLFEEGALYFWGDFACCPGSYSSIFIFEPKSKNFIYFSRKVMSDIDINVISSKSSILFNAERKSRRLLGEHEDSLSDDDIEIIVNDEKLSKKDVDDGRSIENQEAIFSCEVLGFTTPEINYHNNPDNYPDNYKKSIERGKINIRRYIKYFPDKFPCFVNEESDKITGYFGLVENKFVSAEDSK